ncbi:MAG: hypothetical protein OXB88_04385 [Bacteriovoracales bacterium]|nr:hypothetical protein [Bacteriovoracales bacterium]
MHHVQVGEVDSKTVLKGRRFEILVSGIGFNLDEATDIGKGIFHKDQEAFENIKDLISAFQMGPRTGNPVFSVAYTDKIFGSLKKECPSGDISGLTSVRETAKYPVVSGEIIKIIGYCLEK